MLDSEHLARQETSDREGLKRKRTLQLAAAGLYRVSRDCPRSSRYIREIRQLALPPPSCPRQPLLAPFLAVCGDRKEIQPLLSDTVHAGGVLDFFVRSFHQSLRDSQQYEMALGVAAL